jgi:N-hydroxyarylamine O-acetyltransferase
MQANAGGVWRTLYRFDLQEQFPIDYAVSNYFLSTNPASHFRSSLVAARALPGLRLALSNNRLSTHRINDGSESFECSNAEELAAILQSRLGITIPDAAAFATIAHEKLFEVKQ